MFKTCQIFILCMSDAKQQALFNQFLLNVSPHILFQLQFMRVISGHIMFESPER